MGKAIIEPEYSARQKTLIEMMGLQKASKKERMELMELFREDDPGKQAPAKMNQVTTGQCTQEETEQMRFDRLRMEFAKMIDCKPQEQILAERHTEMIAVLNEIKDVLWEIRNHDRGILS